MSDLTGKVRQAKAWWTSNTAIGLIFLVIPTLLKLIVPSFSGDIQEASDVALDGGEQLAIQIDQIIFTLMEIFGGVKTALGIRKAAGGEKLTLK